MRRFFGCAGSVIAAASVPVTGIVIVAGCRRLTAYALVVLTKREIWSVVRALLKDSCANQHDRNRPGGLEA
jgi:hypothetical protein